MLKIFLAQTIEEKTSELQCVLDPPLTKILKIGRKGYKAAQHNKEQLQPIAEVFDIHDG